jgi:pyruvate dehydrogenase E2 component (dihydrolipoamide acetyltransferase)
VDGVLLETFFEEGALVPVFTAICAIGAPGEKVDVSSPASAGGADGPDQAGGAAGTAAPPPLAAPGPATAPVPGTPAGSNGAGPSGQAPLSPRARRFAREHGIEPSSVEGTGPHGRALESDLRSALHTGARPLVPAKPTVEAASPGQAVAGAPVSSVRQRIAKRLRESLSTTAQYTLHSSANAGGLLAVRKKMKASPATADININDLMVFCTVRALMEAPEVNATFTDGALYRYAAVHIGFACDTDRGLVVPVVRDAQDLSLVGVARRLKELAAHAVAGTIGVDDLQGGTFTISNLGSLGVESFTPVLNPPQVAILGVNAIGLKPVRKPDGNIELIDSIGLSLTLDHQVVDGAPGAKFLRALRAKVEDAEALCTI